MSFFKGEVGITEFSRGKEGESVVSNRVKDFGRAETITSIVYGPFYIEKNNYTGKT